MTTPKRRPDHYHPYASRRERIRNAKVGFSAEGVGHRMDESPSSRLKIFGIGFVIAMIVLFIILDFFNRAERKKGKSNFHYQPIADMQIDQLI
ncbi:MAG: hypothetical protein QF676_04480 [Dehalococcoidia bacterium]|jgi:hypothetical protein|nr:hypothetical protein [Dehalococcoidia bacterium]